MKAKFSVFILLLLLTCQINAQIFKAGAAVRNITPAHLIPISGGMGEPVMPIGYKGKLTVRAFVLEKDGTKVAIVSIKVTLRLIFISQ